MRGSTESVEAGHASDGAVKRRRMLARCRPSTRHRGRAPLGKRWRSVTASLNGGRRLNRESRRRYQMNLLLTRDDVRSYRPKA
jgi:hypothetical protein